MAVPVTVNAIPATPTITPDGSLNFCPGAPISRLLTSSSATGNQWYMNGSPIGGAVNDTYTATTVGSYTVVVTAAGCSSAASAAVVVGVNPTPVVYPYFIPGGVDGTAYAGATFTAGVGPAPYGYAVTAGTVPPGLTFTDGGVLDTATLTGTPTAPGVYVFTVTVTDGNGCTGSRQYLVAVQPVPCTSTDLTVTPASIAPVTVGTVGYSQAFGANGGTAPYAFQIGGILPAGLSFTTDTISGTPTATGIYPITVGVTDDAGCTAYRQYLLVVTCNGVTLTLDPAALSAGTIGVSYGPVTFTTTGGTASYTYIQAGMLPAGMSFVGDQLLGTPTVGGTYPLMVASLDSNGCPGVAVYTLVVSCSAVTPVNAAADPATLCGSGTTDLSTDTPASGYDIKWYDAATGGSLLHTGQPWTTGTLSAGTTFYAATYEIATGCESARVAVPVTVNAIPALFAVTGGGTHCTGDLTGVAVGLSGSESGTNYQLKWNGSNVGSPVPGTGSAISFPNQTVAGTYTVMATNGDGCTRTMTGNAVVTEKARPTSTLPYSDYEICSGGTALIQVNLTGTGPWNIHWSDGTDQNGVTQNPATRSVTRTTDATYSITGLTDATGCSATNMTGTSTVSVFPPPSAAVVNATDQVCKGVEVTITINLAGSAPWNLVWSDGYHQNNIPSASATRVVSPDVTTVYSVVTVTDSHCLTSDVSGSHTVTVLPLPTAVLSGGDTICSGGSTDLTVTFTGTAPWAVRFSDNFYQGNIMVNPYTRTVYPTATTTYTLIQLQDANCMSSLYSGSATVTVWTLPTSTLTGTTEICAGQSTDLSVELTGSGPWNLVWSDGHVDSGLLVSPEVRTVSPASTTAYSIISVTGACGAGTPSGTATVTVGVVSVEAGPDGVIWYADTDFYLTDATPPGGTWSGDHISSDGLFSPLDAGIGTHVVTYTYTLGSCTNFDTRSIRVDQVWLLRNAQVVSADPITPDLSTIFTRFPGDPSLENHDWEAQAFASGGAFTHEKSDLTATDLPLIFYQITLNPSNAAATWDSLRLAKDGVGIDQKIVITFDLP